MYVSCSKFYWRFCHTLVNWKSVSQILCNLYTQCSMCPKKTFILPQKYHDSVLHMLSQLLKCVPKTKTNIYFSGQTCYWPLTKSWFKDFTLPHLESCSNTIPMTTVHVSVSIGFRTPATSKVEISVRTVNGFQLFTFVKKNTVFVVERILNLPLLIFWHKISLVWQNQSSIFGYFSGI